MQKSFFQRLANIDEIIRSGPSACSVRQQLLPLLLEDASVEYFYTNIVDPAWLEPLSEAGEFAAAPEPKPGPDPNLSVHPVWWQGRYLETMAGRVPEKVQYLLNALPDSSNFRVNHCIVSAALAMPPSTASLLVPRIVRWIERTQYLVLAEDYASLIVRLAEGKQSESTFVLTRALLRLRTYERSTASYLDMGKLSGIEAIIGNDSFKHVLKKIVPVLCESFAMSALQLLCDLLSNALLLPRSDDEASENAKGEWDGPPAIEEHEQNRLYDSPREELLYAVRDAADSLIKSQGIEVLAKVESYEPIVFQRVGLYLRWKWPEVDPEGTDLLLQKPEVYSQRAFHHEMFHLLNRVFSSLSLGAQQTFFNHVERIRDIELFTTSYAKWHGAKPSHEETERAMMRRVFDELVPVRDYLPEDWKRRFKDLQQKYGFEISDHPDFLYYISSAFRAPVRESKSFVELAECSVRDIVRMLTTPQPSMDPFDVSEEGPGFSVSELVRANPEKYLAATQEFKVSYPNCVGAFLSAVGGLVKAGYGLTPADWTNVLNLCLWVVNQERDAPLNQGRYADLNPGWGWARKEITDIIEDAVKSELVSLPEELRQEVWQVLYVLTEDPDPTPATDAEADSPMNLSINCVRGRAMHALMQYALWRRRALEKSLEASELTGKGFDLMPEVREVLDKRIDTSIDPSRAIRSVYGQWFPWLVLLDKNWSSDSVDLIFPQGKDESIFFDSAWETYIMFCRPYNNVFPLLRHVYAFAVGKIGTWRENSMRLADPDERLMEHLIVYYWRGLLSIDDSMLHEAYHRASSKLRGHALQIYGRILQENPAMDDHELERAKRFWEWRRDFALSAANPVVHGEEIKYFGDWFSADAFDEAWSLQELEAVLRAYSWAESDDLVMKRLADLSVRFHAAVLSCLALMVEGVKDQWNIHAWRKEIRLILSNVIQSGEPQDREGAIALANRLGAMGHLDFRDLV